MEPKIRAVAQNRHVVVKIGRRRSSLTCLFDGTARSTPFSFGIQVIRAIRPGLALEVHNSGFGPEVLEKIESPLAAAQGRNPALRIAAITENDCLGRTGLGACRLDLAVARPPSLVSRNALHLLDALNAKAAFFHDAPVTNGDVGIELILQRLVPARGEKVEEVDGVRAVVRAEASSDAAVVN